MSSARPARTIPATRTARVAIGAMAPLFVGPALAVAAVVMACRL